MVDLSIQSMICEIDINVKLISKGSTAAQTPNEIKCPTTNFKFLYLFNGFNQIIEMYFCECGVHKKCCID